MSQAPDLADLIRRAFESRLEDLHTATVGKVLSYNSVTQTADVQPMVQRVVPGDDAGNLESESFPHIPNVPVVFPRTKAFESHIPLTAGDSVLLIFLTRSIAEWRATGVESTPGDVRLQSLGSVVAMPGLFPDSDKMTSPVLVTDPYQGLRNGPKVVYTAAAIEVRDDVGLAMPVAVAAKVAAAFGLLKGVLDAQAASLSTAPTAPILAGGLATSYTAISTAIASTILEITHAALKLKAE
jgi:hypothetical protein